MERLLQEHPLILMEAAITENLKRVAGATLHPALSISPLIYDPNGRRALERLYRDYLATALGAGLPFVMFTPTWRANRERVAASGLPTLNTDAVRFMRHLKDTHARGRTDVKIGGLIGCRNDSYQPAAGLSPGAAEQFHAWQIEELTAAGVDFLVAETLPAVPEAIGIARAMAKTGLAYIVSFVIDRSGNVLDGTPLARAVRDVDAATGREPLGYMVNCSYPTFLHAGEQPEALFRRLIGYQANASSLDHCDLDGAGELRAEEIDEWGKAMLDLNARYGVRLLGGCCGTGVDHLRYIVAHRVTGAPAEKDVQRKVDPQGEGS